MTVLIAVFKSKTEVFKFLEELRDSGVSAQTTGTPKEARIGCGLAVKFPPSALEKARKIIYFGFYHSFYGIYAVSSAYGRTSTSKIV